MLSTLSQEYDLLAEDVRKEAANRWIYILTSLCPGMFDDAVEHLGEHVTCPFHGGREDFRFLKHGSKHGGSTDEVGAAMCTCGSYPDGFSVLQRAMGWGFGRALREVHELLGGSSVRPASQCARVVPHGPSKADQESVTKRNERLWNQGQRFGPAEVGYYRARGIADWVLLKARDLRLHPKLGYYKASPVRDERPVKVGDFPAMLALMRNAAGEPVAVHRTWLNLTRDDKAPVGKAKKLSACNDASAAAIRLFDARGAEELGVCEGIETGLSAFQLSAEGYFPEHAELPVWPCFAEANLRAFVLPESLLPTVRRLVIFADHDANGKGMEAASVLKERMAQAHPHIEVIIHLPPTVGDDWNDVLRKRASH